MRSWFAFICICAAQSCPGQAVEDRNAIMEPVEILFTGMHRGDSAMVHRAFMPRPTMATVTTDKRGAPALRMDDFQRFLTLIGTPHPETWSEPIWDAEIRSDGNLAQVWAKYAFYVGNRFSHCGVDAFQMFRGEDGKWRIFFIVDTRRTEGCEVPDSIAAQFKR